MLQQDVSLWSWGVGINGELGGGNNANRNTPQRVGVTTNWKAISAGQSYALAIKQDGGLWTWGYNNYGQLGDGTRVAQSTPVQVGATNNWKSSSSCQGYHSVLVKNDRTFWLWGAIAAANWRMVLIQAGLQCPSNGATGQVHIWYSRQYWRTTSGRIPGEGR